MKALTRFAEAIKGVEKTLFGLILGSALFSFVSVLAQGEGFGVQFKALTEIIGVISGTAAVLTVFLGRIRHPDDEFQHLLEHRPVFLGTRSAGFLLLSAVLLYLYYRYAMAGSEVCLLFFAPGIYFFFFTLAFLAASVQQHERQTQLWESLSEEQRANIRDRRRRLKRLHEEMQETDRTMKGTLRDFEQQTARQEAEHRADARREQARKLREGWANLRWRILGEKGLTQSERDERVVRERELEEDVETVFARGWCDDLDRIRAGTLERLKIERAPDLIVFRDKRFSFVITPGSLNEAEAVRHLQRIGDLVSERLLEHKQIRVVISEDTDLSLEARKVIDSSGFTVLDERKIRELAGGVP